MVGVTLTYYRKMPLSIACIWEKTNILKKFVFLLQPITRKIKLLLDQKNMVFILTVMILWEFMDTIDVLWIVDDVY